MTRTYIIWAPPQCRSNGVRALYKLAEKLEQAGVPVYVYCSGSPVQGYPYMTKITGKMMKNDIIIYPESVPGNPCCFQNVVRWVLYYPGKNGGAASYHPSEKIFTWLPKFYPGAPELRTHGTPPEFKDIGLERDTDCFFVYKGENFFRPIPEIENAVEITKDYPTSRPELIALLQRTKTLYSFDPETALLDEALACGCKVKIVRPDGLEDFTKSVVFTDKEAMAQVRDFIAATKDMNYTGKIEEQPTFARLPMILFKFLNYAFKYYILKKEKYLKKMSYNYNKLIFLLTPGNKD